MCDPADPSFRVVSVEFKNSALHNKVLLQTKLKLFHSLMNEIPI